MRTVVLLGLLMAGCGPELEPTEPTCERLPDSTNPDPVPTCAYSIATTHLVGCGSPRIEYDAEACTYRVLDAELPTCVDGVVTCAGGVAPICADYPIECDGRWTRAL